MKDRNIKLSVVLKRNIFQRTEVQSQTSYPAGECCMFLGATRGNVPCYTTALWHPRLPLNPLTANAQEASAIPPRTREKPCLTRSSTGGSSTSPRRRDKWKKGQKSAPSARTPLALARPNAFSGRPGRTSSPPTEEAPAPSRLESPSGSGCPLLTRFPTTTTTTTLALAAPAAAGHSRAPGGEPSHRAGSPHTGHSSHAAQRATKSQLRRLTRPHKTTYQNHPGGTPDPNLTQPAGAGADNAAPLRPIFPTSLPPSRPQNSRSASGPAAPHRSPAPHRTSPQRRRRGGAVKRPQSSVPRKVPGPARRESATEEPPRGAAPARCRPPPVRPPRGGGFPAPAIFERAERPLGLRGGWAASGGRRRRRLRPLFSAVGVSGWACSGLPWTCQGSNRDVSFY